MAALGNPTPGLDPVDAVGAERRERDDIDRQQFGGDIDDRRDDPRAVEVRDELAADREHPLDGVEPLPPLVVQPGRPERRRQRVDDHLGQGDLGGTDRALVGPLEVDDPEQLVLVDDRCGDLAPDVVARRPIVRVGEDVGHELGLAGRGRPADDADPDVDLVERILVAGDADHRQPVAADRQVHRDEGDLELAGDVVDDRLDDDRDGLRAIEPGDDPIERLERVEPFAPACREPLGLRLGLGRDLEQAGHPGRGDERHDGAHDELVAQVAAQADPLGDLPVGDQDRRPTRPPCTPRRSGSPGVSAA